VRPPALERVNEREQKDVSKRRSLTSGRDSGRDQPESDSLLVPSLPKGGGAIRGIQEKFQVNAVTGTAAFSIPLPTSTSRGGSFPALTLTYDSGAGNGPFGLGWGMSAPSIRRKTEKQLPQYDDHNESDTFIFADGEDLVPALLPGTSNRDVQTRTESGITYSVARYRPRIEGAFARIEKWRDTNTNQTHWRTTTRDNITSYYGLTSDSKISNPNDGSQVFEWSLCRTHDDKGSISLYNYKKEDFADIPAKPCERHKAGNCTQLYLKEVCYGNKQPYYFGDAVPNREAFLFRIILDYGEHDPASVVPKDVDLEKRNWQTRKDPFSIYRAGFDIRTYRRCSRILMFQCFDAPDLPHNPYLVRSLNLSYEDQAQLGNKSIEGFSLLVRARQCGYKWNPATNSYTTKQLPDFTLSYQPHEWNTAVTTALPDDVGQAPVAIDDKRYLWVDLFSEGIAGILTEQAGGGWFYKSNLGNGEFSKARPVAPKPSFSSPGGRVAIQELEGNGVKYLVLRTSEPQGFFKLTSDDVWEGFKTFTRLPNIDQLDPNLRLIDLNGDGRPDLLITEGGRMRWYPGAGEDGFEISRTVTAEIDEEKGPAILFADQTQSVFLADMSGDGMTDIIRIRNGEICYWPNLGYGRFGAKVLMGNAPLFDRQDVFNPKFLRLADIDGSGTTDLVYLGKNDFRVWLNLNGNEWSQEPLTIAAFPAIDSLADVAVMDFLGSGTACIVHSSPLPEDSRAPLRYIDLMGGKKPHVMIGYENNCGKQVTLEYKSSTHFYLEDKKEGRPWATKLPFPVHCVSKVRIEDHVRETVFSNSYRYSHGYFDADEREFRGFARVEQLDTEDFSQFKLNSARNVVQEDLHQPPVKTVSWFHTGAFLSRDKLLHQCEAEYFRNEVFAEYTMPQPAIKDDLTAEELREAARTCKGLPLRTEVYAADGSALSDKPYSAAQSNVEIRRVQPKHSNRHACFMIVPSESISYSYERNPADPRISHSFVLEVDELGNVKKTASVVYPRIARPAAPNQIPDQVWEEQNKLHIVYGETLFTNDVISDTIYRLRVAYESASFELSGIALPAGRFFEKSALFEQIKTAAVISFEDEFAAGVQRRLSGHQRNYFLKDDLSDSMPLGQLPSLGIPHRSYQLAFTKQLVPKYYGTKVTPAMLTSAKYVHSEGDEDWWAPSGTAIYAVNPKNNFYIPVGARDIFGNEQFVAYDKYTLLVNNATDAIGNKVTATNDYRTLMPVLITDPNLNRSAVETDELGFVIKSAVMGKEGAGEGDTLPDPTARMEYDLFNWQNHQKPNFVHAFVREQHGPANTRWLESYVYSDGCGNSVMVKSKVKSGLAKKWDPILKQVIEIDAAQRWLGNGRTVFNNKGNPVKTYEPYYSDTHEYETESLLVETGSTSIRYYDPIGRVVRNEYPNGTFSRIQFDPWHFKSYDVNDTVKESVWYADRGSPDPSTTSEPASPEPRAAWLAAKHHDTPSTFYLDSIGRPCCTLSDQGGGQTTTVLFESDSLNRYAKSFDQLGREASFGVRNLLGAPIYSNSAELGEKWILLDAMGRLFRAWSGPDRQFRCTYDKLHRPVSRFVQIVTREILYLHNVYGDLLANAEQHNMKGNLYQVFDQSGMTTLKRVDFKGNLLESERKLPESYDRLVDWSALEGLTSTAAIAAAAAPLLEATSFTSATVLNALNHPTLTTLADNSVVESIYSEGSLLESLRVRVRGEGDFITFLQVQDYNARGQRELAAFGNGLITKYSYDPKTFRLINILTRSAGGNDSQSLQNLSYTFDPHGNVVYAIDNAQQTNYFNNAVVRAESKFEYDAIYQLTKATGREHAGLGGNSQRDANDLPYLAQLPHANDLNAVRQFTEVYRYDECGNITSLQHIASDANWTQRYRYHYQDDPLNKTNRLKSSSLAGDPDAGPYTATYQHDPRGNMTRMPHLSELAWNFMEQLSSVNLDGGGRAFYVYESGGRRVRKIVQRPSGKRIERIYLGPLEIYREYQNGTKKFERNTLHVSDNTGRIAQIDTKLLDTDSIDSANPLNSNLIRYCYTNHLGSATMETDEHAAIISYEEYHPYGSSSYRSSKSSADLSLKRYRFCGKERDDETGLYYFGARYYAAWLARWTSSDPAGFVDGPNLYRYCRNNPVMLTDPNGTAPNYLPGTREEHLTPQSTPAERERFAALHGLRIVDPHPEQQRWVGSARRGHWELSPEGRFERITPSERSTGAPAAAAAPASPAAPAAPAAAAAPASPAAPSGGGGGAGSGGGSGPASGGGGGGVEGGGGSSPDSGGGGGNAREERTFWSRGGATLGLGLLMLGAGVLTVLTAGAATPLLVLTAGAMATAGGIAITTTSAVQLGASYSGHTTAEQDRQTSETLHTIGSLSSPLGLTGGVAGQMIADNPEEGLRRGALIGNISELGIGGVRFGAARFFPGSARELSSEAALISDMAQLESTVPRGVAVIGSHGSPGMYQTAAGAMAPISDLAPMIQSGPQGRVMLLMCNVGHDPAAVQALSNQTGRSVTAFTDFVGALNYNNVRIVVDVGGVATDLGAAAPTIFNPQYLSPYLSLAPNIAAPATTTLSGATH
jgi:RHS repeat-associated protein